MGHSCAASLLPFWAKANSTRSGGIDRSGRLLGAILSRLPIEDRCCVQRGATNLRSILPQSPPELDRLRTTHSNRSSSQDEFGVVVVLRQSQGFADNARVNRAAEVDVEYGNDVGRRSG